MLIQALPGQNNHKKMDEVPSWPSIIICFTFSYFFFNFFEFFNWFRSQVFFGERIQNVSVLMSLNKNEANESQ